MKRSVLYARAAASLRGILTAYANVVFSCDPRVGAWVLGAACVEPRRGLLSLLSVAITQLSMSRLVPARDPVTHGWYAYNGLLVALSLPDAPIGQLLALTVAGALATTWLTVVLGDALGRHGLPVLAVPFVLAAAVLSVAPTVPVDLAAAVPKVEHVGTVAQLVSSFGALLYNPTFSVGLVVVAAVCFASRVLLLLMWLGVVVGHFLPRWLFGDAASGAALAAQYNALLSCAAVGCILAVPNVRSIVMGVLAAALAALLSVLLAPICVRLGLPLLAWPFVLATLLTVRVLRLCGVPWFAAAPLPTFAPELNLAYRQMLEVRLGQPGPSRLALPVSGTWSITQGVDGGITHTGNLAYALDFEMLDEERFPFRNEGRALQDYFSFGQPVLATGFGVVAAVFDGQIDNLPGTQDLVRPWGNCVVIHHGAGLYSVLAHLKQHSICVVVGAPLYPGQVIGACGASGRSPRPHLHVQLQASPALGAPTLPFVLLDYFSINQDAQRSFVRAGIPQEWQTIASVPTRAEVTACAGLLSLLPIELHAASGVRHRVSAHVGPSGETYLLDEPSLDCLHYVRTQAGIVFTSLAGSANGLLGSLLQAAPLLPDFELGTFETNETVPAEVTWPGWKRLLHDLARCVAAVSPVQVRQRVQSAAGILVVASERYRAVRRTECLVGRGKLVVDSLGIRQIELTDANGRRTAGFSRGTPEATQQARLSVAQHL